MPGEKEFMAEKLNLSLDELKEKYLSAINTPYGNVDVLKMKDNCNFLDEEYRCTAIPAKPVLCDTYPVVFFISGGKVQFEIDQSDCPMVHWQEYNMAVTNFDKNGIKAIKKMKIPFSWWKKVALFDEFDVDYVRIEQELAKTKGYEEFYLEDILGYACNGYENKARKKGLDLMIIRLKELSTGMGEKIIQPADKNRQHPVNTARMYNLLVKEQCSTMISTLRGYKNDTSLFRDKDNTRYLQIIKEARTLLDQLQYYLKTFKRRLDEVARLDQVKIKIPSPSLIIDQIKQPYKVAFPPEASELSYYQIMTEGSPDFWQALALLSGTFFPNELDSPKDYYRYIRQGRLSGGSITEDRDSGVFAKVWNRWVMVVAKDQSGNFVGVADGALILNNEMSIFYASHIATNPRIRNRGLGTLLSAAVLQAADQMIPAGRAVLGLPTIPNLNYGALLSCEVSEIEFPDLSVSGSSSIKRLSFHGRLGRKPLWPFRYAQPDTDYRKRNFEVSQWNSVPMFLAFRSFSSPDFSVQQAVSAARLLYAYFSGNSAEGAGWDKSYMNAGLMEDGIPEFILFPSKREEVTGFIGKTGTFGEILKRYYPDHKFTRDHFSR